MFQIQPGNSYRTSQIMKSCFAGEKGTMERTLITLQSEICKAAGELKWAFALYERQTLD